MDKIKVEFEGTVDQLVLLRAEVQHALLEACRNELLIRRRTDLRELELEDIEWGFETRQKVMIELMRAIHKALGGDKLTYAIVESLDENGDPVILRKTID